MTRMTSAFLALTYPDLRNVKATSKLTRLSEDSDQQVGMVATRTIVYYGAALASMLFFFLKKKLLGTVAGFDTKLPMPLIVS